jgi:hypothetical protein
MIHQVFIVISFIRENSHALTYVRAVKEWQILGSVWDKRRQTKRNVVTKEEIQDIQAQLEVQIMKVLGTRNTFQWNLCL